MAKHGVRLKPNKEIIFENRHQWIFSGAIASFPDAFENGGIYPIYSDRGECLGHGYFNKEVSLAGRILSFGKEDPWTSIYQKLEEALSLRKKLFQDTKTTGYRLVNGEGDFLPGLVIDQYGEDLVLSSNTLGVDQMKGKIVDFLASLGRWRGIHEKSYGPSRREEGLQDEVKTLVGAPKETFSILENALLFEVDWQRGQKTGFFLDQREMRKKVGEIAKGKRVFNCFCYTGGFSVYALQGGAIKVDSLDVSKVAVEKTKRHIELNHLEKEGNTYFHEDAFDFLAKEPLDYDLVILDPPAFAKKKGDIAQAAKGYREINLQALRKMPKGSFLLTCSCSYYIDEVVFEKVLLQAARMANRDVQVVGKHLLGGDHPLSLAHPESDYLKSRLLYVR